MRSMRQRAVTIDRDRRLLPRIHALVRQALADHSLLETATALHNGPVHLVFPEVFAENIAEFHAIFADLGIDSAVAYAAKPNKSPVFLRVARHCGASVDVASQSELTAALAAGFTGQRISCTGPKSRRFLLTALLHSCLISVDSIDELHLIAELLPEAGRARVLLRVADPNCVGRLLKPKVSRFGLVRSEIQSALAILEGNPGIELAGLHVHAYESGETRAGYAFGLLELTRILHAAGHEPTIINIGGGYRHPVFDDAHTWPNYVNDLADRVKSGVATATWRQNAMGLARNENGGVTGREIVMGLNSESTPRTMLTEIFQSRDSDGRELASVVAETMLTAMVEPGAGLLDQCGVSLVRVLGTKQAPDGSSIVVLDANGYNLGIGMQEVVADPLLIGDEAGETHEPVFLAGNLCKEGDLVMRRAVHFGRAPKRGDVLCFANTAAYASDFEDTAAIGQPTGRKFVVTTQTDGSLRLGDEESFEEMQL